MYLNSNKKVDIKTGTCVVVFFGFVTFQVARSR